MGSNHISMVLGYRTTEEHTHIHHSMPFCMAGQFRCPTHHQEQYESSKDIVNEICVHWISTATKICNQVLDAILCLLDALNLAYVHAWHTSGGHCLRLYVQVAISSFVVVLSCLFVLFSRKSLTTDSAVLLCDD